MVSLPNPVDIRYGGFYLPVFSLVYIFQNVELPAELPLLIFTLVLNQSNFSVFLALTFLGALVGHGESRSIYGVEGAKENPKNRWVVLWYRALFSLKSTPGKPPRNISELSRKLEHSVEWFLALSIPGMILVSLHRLIRVLTIWTSKLAFLGMALLTTWTLAVTALNGSLRALGTLLLVAQFVFFFGSWVFSRFPSTVPVESARWLYLAEYHKPRHLKDKGEIEFEYGPTNVTESVLDDLERGASRLRDRPPHFDQDDVEWLVPLEEEPEYLVELENKDDEDGSD